MNSAPVDAKMEAFGFNVITIDGHDYDQIEGAFNGVPRLHGQADGHPDAHHQGQGREVYGKSASIGTAKRRTTRNMKWP